MISSIVTKFQRNLFDSAIYDENYLILPAPACNFFMKKYVLTSVSAFPKHNLIKFVEYLCLPDIVAYLP